MTMPISSTTGATAGGVPIAAPTPTTSTTTNQFSGDTFLKLLVAQLKYQDPSSPVDSTQFLAQTAQFQMVQQLTQLSTQMTETATSQRVLEGVSMIGSEVTWTAADGGSRTAVVSAAHVSPTGVTVTAGGQDVDLASITSISSPHTTAAPTI